MSTFINPPTEIQNKTLRFSEWMRKNKKSYPEYEKRYYNKVIKVPVSTMNHHEVDEIHQKSKNIFH